MSQTLFDVTRDGTPQIIFGADVTMTTVNDEIILHTPGDDGRNLIGRFSSVADAWEALDAIDTAEDLGAEYRAA